MFKKNRKIPKCDGPSLRARNNWMANKKSRIGSFYDILESVAWLWRFSGVFPMTIEDLTAKKIYKINKIFAAYGVTIFLLRVANFIYFMMTFESHFGKGPVRITTVTTITRTTGNILCMFVSTVCRIPQSAALSGLINDIAEQDLILNKMNCRSNYKSIIKTMQASVSSALLAVVFFIVHDIKAIRRTSPSFSMGYILWYVGLFIQLIDLTVLATLVQLLGLHFHSLNQKIRTVVTRANASSAKVLVTSEVCAEQLRLIAKLHYNMCAVGKRINRIFDWDMILNVIVAFIALSTSLYYVFYEIQRDRPTDVPQILAHIHWELYHGVPMIIIVIICNLTSHQSVRTGKLIHEIRVVNKDSELYQAVKTFSLQLHHQKLEFTAGGFFPIDSTLLQTMVGKITTYLVILIQFKPKLD